MRSVKIAATVVALCGLLLAASACITEGEAAETGQPNERVSAAVQGAGLAARMPLSQSGSPMKVSGALSDDGSIWVTGEGSISVEPDLARLSMGVEAMADTVSESRISAAASLDAIKTALAANGVEDRDIQTRRFSIRPEYQWREVTENGSTTNKQFLVGYRVSNSLIVKVRDLDTIGTLIDEVIAAGGDATRFNGIEFMVEDTSPLMSQLREDAVEDALAKAEHFADLNDVELGRVVFISEPGSVPSGFDSYGYERVVTETAASVQSTSISGGDIKVSLKVQIGYVIR